MPACAWLSGSRTLSLPSGLPGPGGSRGAGERVLPEARPLPPVLPLPTVGGRGAADKLIHAIFTLCIMLHDFILLHSRNLLQ